jgi:hypothetical protein
METGEQTGAAEGWKQVNSEDWQKLFCCIGDFSVPHDLCDNPPDIFHITINEPPLCSFE